VKALLRYLGAAAVILFLFGVFLLPVWQSGNPVVSREVVNATIRSLSAAPVTPNSLARSRRSYLYMIALEGAQSTAFVRDSTQRPHRVGSTIKVERRTHEDGLVTFEVSAQQ
jgi:hypothetical protein